MLTLFYGRTSTDRQDLGLAVQWHRNFALAKMLGRKDVDFEGIALGNRFDDEGVSGGIPFAQRNGAAQLILVIETFRKSPPANFDGSIAVITYDLYRLSRDVDDGRATIKWFDDHGVKLYLSNEGGNAIDVSSAMGRFLVTIRLASGELERGLTGERTKAALGALQARGGKVGEPPFGWRKTEVRATFEENPDEQNVIRRILLLDDEGLSAREIAQRLNSNGVHTRDGKYFTHVQVGRVLQRAENEVE